MIPRWWPARIYHGRVVVWALGFGALTPMRASLAMYLWGPADAGKIGGTLGFIISRARAAPPVAASLIYMAVRPGHGYDAVLAVLLAMSIASGAAVLAADGIALPRLVHRSPRLVERGPS